MHNIEKVSEIKSTISALLKNLEIVERGNSLPESKWEEMMIQSDIVREKLVTMRAQEVRDMIEKLSANEEVKRVVQSFTELRRAFSDLQLNVSKSVIPMSSAQPKPMSSTQPKPSLFQDEGEEIELFADEDRGADSNILDTARHSRHSWRTDLPGSRVDDIKHAITLNDKLYYIKELFNDDEEQYRLSIDRLNEMRNLDEAVDYIRGAFPEWDEDSSEVYRFLMILRRRFDV
ncbi:MAG: hypothetical protein PHV46_03590 [Bacteroidales bacterium]|nr:hypothetical protein [Bacteroidales bacterium]